MTQSLTAMPKAAVTEKLDHLHEAMESKVDAQITVTWRTVAGRLASAGEWTTWRNGTIELSATAKKKVIMLYFPEAQHGVGAGKIALTEFPRSDVEYADIQLYFPPSTVASDIFDGPPPSAPKPRRTSPPPANAVQPALTSQVAEVDVDDTDDDDIHLVGELGDPRRIAAALDSRQWPSIFKNKQNVDLLNETRNRYYAQLGDHVAKDLLFIFAQLSLTASEIPIVCTSAYFEKAVHRLTKRLEVIRKSATGVAGPAVQSFARAMDDEELPDYVQRAERRAVQMLKSMQHPGNTSENANPGRKSSTTFKRGKKTKSPSN